MVVQYSTQSVVSDGTLSTIVLGIKYILRANIYLRIDGVETPQTGAPSGYTWSFLDATTIRVLPVVPTGITVEVYRRTDITGVYNVFSQNAQFDEGTIDENNTQLLYIAQEYLEQDLTGVGIASLEYVRSEPGYEIYRFQRSDETYFPEFPVPTDTAALETHKSSVNQHTIAGVVGLVDALAANTIPVLDVQWLTARTPMRIGYTAGDGQTLSRSLYPDAFAAIQAGLVPVCSDADWLADPTKRGCFTLGDGSTTFRVPDYNGKSVGSLGAVFQRGDGALSAVQAGLLQRDAMQGHHHAPKGDNDQIPQSKGASGGAGSFVIGTYWTFFNGVGNPTSDGVNGTPRTASETRSLNVTGCWAVKLFGAVQNAGSADAGALATAVADLAARMSVLEQRKSTCLVNATGTGAPHETVVAQLPANITVNTRYVLPNPFGNNTPVICWAEIFAGGIWANTGFIYAHPHGYGVVASYVQGSGIVVQTGSSRLAAGSSFAGGGHGSTVEVDFAQCRVFVRKLEA